MFRDVPECSGMFRNVPCSCFYRRPAKYACESLKQPNQAKVVQRADNLIQRIVLTLCWLKQTIEYFMCCIADSGFSRRYGNTKFLIPHFKFSINTYAFQFAIPRDSIFMLFSKPSVSILHLPVLAHAVLHVLCSVLLTRALSGTKIALHACEVFPVHIWERLKSVESEMLWQHCLNFAPDVVTLFLMLHI